MSSAPQLQRRLSVAELQAAVLAAHREVAPQPTAPPPPQRAAPPAVAQAASWWLLGTHGGSGARSLRAVLPGSLDAAKQWPDLSGQTTPSGVVLVCRSHAAGLLSAQALVRAHRDGAAPGVGLLGVVIVDDAPGRRPAPLRRMERLLSGAVPACWHAPWMPVWRLGPPDPATPPDWARKLALTIAAAAGVRA